MTKAYWLRQTDDGAFTFRYSDCAAPVPEAEISAIVRDLAEGMPGYDPPQYFSTQPGIFERYHHLVVASRKEDGRTVGLLGAKWFDSDPFDFLYLWTGMVAASTQRSGLTQRMFKTLMAEAIAWRGVPEVIASKTYSPLWYKAKARMARSVPGAHFFPTLAEQEPELEDIAAAVHRTLTPKLPFERHTGVIRGAQAVVGPDFFPRERPLSGDGVLDAHFARHVTRDDQILTLMVLTSCDRSAVADFFIDRPEAILLRQREVI